MAVRGRGCDGRLALALSLVVIVIVVVVAGCQPVPVVSGSPAATSPASTEGVVPATASTPVEGPSPLPSPQPTVASPDPALPSLTIAVARDPVGGLSDAAQDTTSRRIGRFINAGLYGLDERSRPRPVLARDLPSVSVDGLLWTVTLRSGTTFQDGTPLSAADVVWTFELAMSPACPFARERCLGTNLASVRPIGDRTVAFTLRAPQPGFAAAGLGLWIESAAATKASYDRFRAGFGQLSAADTNAFLSAAAAHPADPGLRQAGEALLQRAAVPRPDVAAYTEAGVLDSGSYLRDIEGRVEAIDASFSGRPRDALAAAHPYLDIQDHPLGSGPFTLERYVPGDRIELRANPRYALGPPAIERLIVRIAPSETAAVDALASGLVDWADGLSEVGTSRAAGNAGVRIVRYPSDRWIGLVFDLDPAADGLFLDRPLRQALAACVDKPASVAAATDGQGIPIDSPVPAASWASPADVVPSTPLDRNRAVRLIEGTGWARGRDGIFAKAGRRLATVVAVEAGFPQRSRWLAALGRSVRACGIEVGYREVSHGAFRRMVDVYPHLDAAAAGARRPFDAYLDDLPMTPDPDRSAGRPTTCSFGVRTTAVDGSSCYRDPTVDGLAEAGRATTDLVERSILYRDEAVRRATDLPVLPIWSDAVRGGISAALGTVDGARLRLDSPTWFEPIERLKISR